MTGSLNFKSLVIGAALGIGAMLLLGAKSDGLPVGRFQIAAAMTTGGTVVYVIDTATGQGWSYLNAQTGPREEFQAPKIKE